MKEARGGARNLENTSQGGSSDRPKDTIVSCF